MLDVVDEALAISKAAEHERLPAMRALAFTFLNPCSEAIETCQFAAGRAHFRFLNILETNIALQK